MTRPGPEVRALVMGLGRFGGGLGSARHLLRLGCAVTVTDLAAADTLEASLAVLTDDEKGAITWRLGTHDEADFAAAELVVVNPAVPPSSRFIALAREAGARITSEVELFLEATSARLILITGTQGKSSTAHLTAGLLREAGRKVTLAGNIGRSLLAELQHEDEDTEYVVELSSYQLEALPSDARHLAKADVAIITNLLVDHIARHGTTQSYHAAKRRIAELVRPGGLLLVPAGTDFAPPGLRTATFATQAADYYTLEDAHFTGPQGALAEEAHLTLPGDYQRTNALAALAAASERGLTYAELDTALPKLGGLEHRSQELGAFGPHATRVIDNAVSTTPDSTQSALEATGTEPVILLIGGHSKHMPMDALVAACRTRLVHLIAFGEAAVEFEAPFAAAGLATHIAPTVEAAVALGFDLARPGDTLLFSPAGSSFDAYSNFKQRAMAFRATLPPLHASCPSTRPPD